MAVEEHEPATLENPVDDGLGEVMVVQNAAPPGERWLVGGEQHRPAAQMTLVDDVEQDVGGIRAVG